jgi:hypothetical protein
MLFLVLPEPQITEKSKNSLKCFYQILPSDGRMGPKIILPPTLRLLVQVMSGFKMVRLRQLLVSKNAKDSFLPCEAYALSK